MGKLARLAELFAGRHFDREVIILCVRWYLRFKLSLRDLVEMMAERGLSLARTTIMRSVQRYTPEFEKRWHRYALAVGQSWRVHETYVTHQSAIKTTFLLYKATVSAIGVE
jgi:transposase-like protein